MIGQSWELQNSPLLSIIFGIQKPPVGHPKKSGVAQKCSSSRHSGRGGSSGQSPLNWHCTAKGNSRERTMIDILFVIINSVGIKPMKIIEGMLKELSEFCK